MNACPACSCEKYRGYSDTPALASVKVCEACGSVYGLVTLEDSFQVVSEHMSYSLTDDIGHVYFHLKCVTSKGIVWRHGWYQPDNGLITQIG